MKGHPLVGYDRLLEEVRVEGDLLARAAFNANPDADVPWCPGLTLTETVRHVASLYRMVLSWVRGGDRPTTWQREPDDGQPVVEYYQVALRMMLDQLAAHDPAEECPTWWPEQQNYGFWYRRLAHETTMHRVDVQGAAGLKLGGVSEDIAVDGIDEVLTLWFEHRLTVLGVSGTRSALVKVRAGEYEWITRATPTGTSAWRTTGDEVVDGTVSGEPATIFLWLWGRQHPHVDVEREGSDDAIAQLWALLRLATR